MTALKAILATVGIVCAALCITLTVLVIVWLAGNYRVELMIGVAGLLVGAAGLLVGLIAYLLPRR